MNEEIPVYEKGDFVRLRLNETDGSTPVRLRLTYPDGSAHIFYPRGIGGGLLFSGAYTAYVFDLIASQPGLYHYSWLLGDGEDGDEPAEFSFEVKA